MFGHQHNTAGNRAPTGPFVLNKDSPQAQGLVGWFPAGATNNPNGSLGVVDRSLYGHNLNVVSGAPSVELNTHWNTFGLNVYNASNCLIAGTQIPMTSYPFSTTAWFAPGGMGNGNTPCIMSLGDASASNVRTAMQYISTGNVLRAFCASTTNTSVDTTNGISDENSPHLGVCTFAQTYRKVVWDADFSGAGEDTTDCGSTFGFDRIGLGAIADSSPSSYWQTGLLFESRVYDILLPDAVIQHMHDPSTRFDLYYQTGLKTYSFDAAAPPVGGATIAPQYHHFRMMHSQ